MGYLILTLCTFLPIILAIWLFKLTFKIWDLFLMVGLVAGIYWLLITSGLITFAINKYIEINNVSIFIEKAWKSIWTTGI